jgi:SAM-dependent methyltransferase
MALSGAKKVVGLDIDAQNVAIAKKRLRQQYPSLIHIVEFLNMEVKDYPGYHFDCIVSKNTFEHILNFQDALIEMKARLKINGRVYAGFGPLYKSPFGHHGWLKVFFPWGHLIIPESIIIWRLNLARAVKITTIQDLRLNKLSLADFKKAFYESGFTIYSFKINQSNNVILRFSAAIAKIFCLEEYFAHNIYCILENK